MMDRPPLPIDARRRCILAICGCSALLALAAQAASPPSTETLRTWTEEIKKAPRGPFSQIRWFCKDGTVLPPKAYACRDHGGGVQHGEWTDRVRTMRDNGYLIANVLADLEAGDFVGEDADLVALKQILLERFLIEADDGWVLRAARSYRGSLQIEDEEAGALRVLYAMLADPRWRTPARFLLLREAVRLLPVQGDEVTSTRVRQLALEISEQDSDFNRLRIKIHNAPDASDAKSVRDYAAKKGKPALKGDYAKLADAIDALYATGSAAAALEDLAARTLDSEFAAVLRQGRQRLTAATGIEARFTEVNRLLLELRDNFSRESALDPPEISLAVLQASLLLERASYTSGNSLMTSIDDVSRRRRLEWIGSLGNALYGVGFISERHLRGLRVSLRHIEDADPLTTFEYRTQLRYLSRAPEWSARWMAYHFGRTVERWHPLEPLAEAYPQDRLRGSPLLIYGMLVDGLVLDANRLAGIEHELFGKKVGAGLRALNPGLTHGTLRTLIGGEELVEPDGIYLLPETTGDLPPVAGILTQGEGSSLSHVQLLARNLGIPNVVVGDELLPEVRAHAGTQVVLAVSPKGVVQLDAYTSEWDKVFGRNQQMSEVVIRPDLEKLDIESVELIPLSDLRASDSGRTSGPKGANLGELMHAYGNQVPPGFVIPFGAFRKLLDQPIERGGPSVFEWMKERYDAIEAAESKPEIRKRLIREFLQRLRTWIENADPGPEFRAKLRTALQEYFGEDGTYGVFVRSDTNVEDLPGFTGAGLNLTVPYVVGYENILAAIGRVWASPFTERAFGWRQSHMELPEYVFPAVVIQIGFPSEKSGVMVTVDVDTGEAGWITLAVNEGVGGAVEGQAAESLKVDTNRGRVRFLAQATAPERAVLDPRGGVSREATSGTDRVLQNAEIAQLIRFAREIPERFPSLRAEDGQAIPADVEFGFRNGKLALLQMRPFVESRSARYNQILTALDEEFEAREQETVDLDGIPRGLPQ